MTTFSIIALLVVGMLLGAGLALSWAQKQVDRCNQELISLNQKYYQDLVEAHSDYWKQITTLQTQLAEYKAKEKEES